MTHDVQLNQLPDGIYAARFYDLAERRRTLRLGREKTPAADTAHHLQRLLEYRRVDRPLPPDLESWVQALPPRWLKKLIQWGILASSGLAVTEPIMKHVDDFRTYLANKLVRGRKLSPKRVEDAYGRLKAAIDDCGFERWGDVTEERLHAYLIGLREHGRPLSEDDLKKGKKPRPLSELTARAHAQAWRQFAAWMVRTGRAVHDPIARLVPADYGTQTQTKRRAFSAEELTVLLDVAEGEWVGVDGQKVAAVDCYGLTGGERALAYLVAAETGLRASELAAVTVRQFDLSGDQPVVRLTSDQTKNGKVAELPIRKSTAAILAEHFGRKMPDAPALAMPRIFDCASMFREDLAEARALWLAAARTAQERQEREQSDFLAEQDHAGRVAVFHSLRHSTASLLVGAGVHPKIAQAHLRHSDIKLTMDLYAHADRRQAAAVAEQMPELRRRHRAEATGTTDEKAHQFLNKNHVRDRREVSATVTGSDDENDAHPLHGRDLRPEVSTSGSKRPHDVKGLRKNCSTTELCWLRTFQPGIVNRRAEGGKGGGKQKIRSRCQTLHALAALQWL